MNELYEAFQSLNLDRSLIGLEAGTEEGDYFCTPIGAHVIGWDNGIHYCLIDGFGETVFCVNPEPCCDFHVYPLARNFYDFLSLLLATKHTNTMQQVICWDESAYNAFLRDPNTIRWAEDPKTVAVLDTIATKLQIEAMDNPFRYIKELQKDFPYNRIPFTNEYYDTLGLERPDGTNPYEEFDKTHQSLKADVYLPEEVE